MGKNKLYTVAFALLLAIVLGLVVFGFPFFTAKRATLEITEKVSNFSFEMSYWNTSTTIYILSNGTVDPPSAPIQRNGSSYTLTDDIFTTATQGIVIERDNMTLDGAGYTVQGATHSGSTGILIWWRNNVTLEHALVEAFTNGIVAYESSNDTIFANTAIDNSEGIVLFGSSNNTVSENNVTANDSEGILLQGSSNNTIFENNVVNSTTGIYVIYSFSNRVYHNNIINNTSQAYAYNSTGTWDDDYPSGGNYWSDYNGTDSFRGLYQTVAGSDGIGDTARAIDPINKDDYPLTGPFGDATQSGLNATVFPSSDVGLIFENVTQAGSTTVAKTSAWWPVPTGLTLVGEYYSISTSAIFSGNLTVRITYDDTNLTQAQENSLQLLQYQLQQCDVTGSITGVPDGKVDMRDIAYLAKRFMTTPSSPNWDPRCDVVPDGIVNMRDIGKVALAFGKKGYWVSITTYIDTLSNVIYGEAGHLSMFGVTRE